MNIPHFITMSTKMILFGASYRPVGTSMAYKFTKLMSILKSFSDVAYSTINYFI